MVGQALPESDVRGRETPAAMIVELQQAEPLLADAQGDQGDRLVALAVAAVAGAGLAVLVGGGRQQLASCCWSRSCRAR